MSDYQLAPSRSKIFDKLPVNHATAAQMIDIYITPLLERAGMTVTTRKTKNTRTLKIELPTK
jgi:hypothetical protein